MLGMPAGERADAVRAEEAALVQHASQHPAQLVLVERREHAPPAVAGLADRVDVGGQLRALGSEMPECAPCTSGMLSNTSGSKMVTAVKGSNPTIERTLMRWALPSGITSTS